MKYITLALILFIHYTGHGQNEFKTVNRVEVEIMVSDSTKLTYYPKLLGRFQEDDTTLTTEEFRLLYYGFVFQKEYSGYPDLKQKEINDAIGKKNYDEASKLCDSVLSQYPINLFANYNKGLALFLKDSSNTNFARCIDRFKKILNAILSSGDGLTCKTAFKTIFVNDEYQVMYRYFEIKTFNGVCRQKKVDFLLTSVSDV